MQPPCVLLPSSAAAERNLANFGFISYLGLELRENLCCAFGRRRRIRNGHTGDVTLLSR
jgi:hypothetical protein